MNPPQDAKRNGRNSENGNPSVVYCFYCRQRAKGFNSHFQTESHFNQVANAYGIKEDVRNIFLPLLKKQINCLVGYVQCDNQDPGAKYPGKVLFLEAPSADEADSSNPVRNTKAKVYYDFVLRPQSQSTQQEFAPGTTMQDFDY